MLYAGIDIGGTSVKLGVLDEAGTLIHKGSVDTVSGNPEALVDRIADAFSAFRGRIAAAGVSCAGRVNPKNRTVIAGNLKWKDVPFAAMLEERLGCPVTIDNDVAGALMAEWKMGACRGERDVLYISLGTGVGGAFLIDGKPYRGPDNNGGEIGHMVTHAEGLPCSCGGRGCYEVYASATALARMGGADPREIFRLAEAGDARMNAVLDEYVHELVIGLAGLTAIFSPALIVIGGGLSNAGEPLLRRVTDQLLHRRPTIPKGSVPPVVLAELGNMAGVYGGAAMAMELEQKTP